MKNKLIQLSVTTTLSIVLSACGGGSSNSDYKEEEKEKTYQEIVGRVIDGYIKDTRVFLDINRNSKVDSDEPQNTTNEYGQFILKLNKNQTSYIDGQHSIIALGEGIDVDTNKPFKTMLVNNPTKDDIKNPIFLTPLSTFVGFTGKNAVFGQINNFAGVGNFKERLTTLFGLDVSKNINYIKDNDLEYYKINNILQKVIEIDKINYEDFTKRLEKDITLNKLLAKSTNKDSINSMKEFYTTKIKQENLENKRESIAKAVSKKIDDNQNDFASIDISNLEKDKKTSDGEDKKPIIAISNPILKEGILHSTYNDDATIFVDRNRNLKLDNDEPRVKTDKNGNFSIKVEEDSISTRKSLVALNGKNSNGEVTRDIVFQTLMREGKVHINTFTSIQTAIALAIADTLTPSGIFHSNFVEAMLKSFQLNANDLKIRENDNIILYKKALKIKAFVRAIANTYNHNLLAGENILKAYKHFSSNITASKEASKYGLDSILDRFHEKNPKTNQNNETFKDLLKQINDTYENTTQENINSTKLKNKIEALIEKAKEFKTKEKPKAVSLVFNLDSDVAMPKDDFSKYQWHLNDTGSIINTNGIYTTGKGDLGVKELYEKKIVGKGVHVRVVDDGVEANHEDLKGRINLEDSNNAETKQNDPTSPKIEDTHGTQVAGLIAADGSNNIGVRGVAPYATLSAYKLKTPKKNALDYTYEELTEAWLGGNDKISIVNNSWGATIDKHIEEEKILEKGATQKRSGQGERSNEKLGRIYLVAAGNGGFNQGEVKNIVDDSATSYIRGSQYAITVAAVRNENIITQYSAQGSNVLVSGYGGGVKTKTAALLTTTTRTGVSTSTWKEDTKKAYTFAFDGTSAATPVTSGALALVMQECPNLSYRDVKWLIAHTAKKIDENYDGLTISGVPNVPPFKTTPQKDLYQGFGYIKNAAGLSHSNYYGYGLINPSTMIEKCTASDFEYLPKKRSIKVKNENTSLTNLYDNNKQLTEKIRVNKNEVKEEDKLDKIEWIGLTIHANIKNLKKVSIVLISPSGTKSRILTNSKTALDQVANIEYGYRFSSVGFIGESPYGEWTILIQTDDDNEKGRLEKIELEIVGHKGDTER